MKTYTVILAEDVPHYATVEIAAGTDADAIAAAKAYDRDSLCLEPEWQNAVCRRIVEIYDDADGRSVACDVAVDDYVLRSGGEAERRLCDAGLSFSPSWKRPAIFRGSAMRLSPPISKPCAKSASHMPVGGMAAPVLPSPAQSATLHEPRVIHKRRTGAPAVRASGGSSESRDPSRSCAAAARTAWCPRGGMT